MKEQFLKMVRESLDKSPLRMIGDDLKGKLELFKEELERVNEIDSIVNKGLDNLNNQLKVVLMGEVKAGKSTLLNVLAGRVISYMNVVEATAAILEVTYGEENICIIRNDNTRERFSSIEELNDVLDKNRENQGFFENIEKISVSSPVERLKEITIVDTPGLNTITDENARRTEEYILNSDVIIWVLNGNHLGQSDVCDKINEVMDLGKPIICAVNRIDEISSNPFELEEYVKDEMGYMFEEVFPISAKMALDGILNNDESLLLESRFNLFNSYLMNNIERNSGSVQIDSVVNSISVQLQREYNVSCFTQAKLQEIKKGIEDEIRTIQSNNNRIKISIEDNLRKWISYDLLSAEKSNVLTSKNPEEDCRMYFDKEYINKLINEEYENLSRKIYNDWMEFGNNLALQKNNNINNGITLDSVDNIVNIEKNSNEDIIKEESKGGLITGSAIAAGLAGYAAWLGPGAAYISIGNAIGAFFPPLLIAGLAGGLAVGFIKAGKDGNQKKIDFNKNIEIAVNNIRKNITNNVFKSLLNSLYSISDKYNDDFIYESESLFIKFDFDKSEFDKIISDLNVYIKDLMGLITEYDDKLN